MSRAPTTTFSERLVLRREPVTAATFAQDVRAGLAARPMRLAPKYFYDELGSALFDAITRLPEYYLTRVERDLLATYGGEIVDAVGIPLELVELGSGSAAKTRILIDALLDRQTSLVYRPIDISPEALVEAGLALEATYPRLRIVASAADYFTLLRRGALAADDRVLALFLGSNVGNFEPDEARRLLALLAAALRRGDALLLGYDLKKDRSILEPAYDDPAGVTAAFNKNLLARINRELGADFALDGFAFRARWNEERGAVESFLVSMRAQRVSIPGAEIIVDLVPGDAIHTESSYKFDREEMTALCAACGFAERRTYTDTAGRYALGLFTVA